MSRSMKNVFEFEAFGKKFEARFVYDKYVDSKTPYIALQTYDKENNYWEDFCEVTTCVDGLKHNSNEIAIQLKPACEENSYWPNIIGKLSEKGIIEFDGDRLYSGFNTYDKYIVDMNKIKENCCNLNEFAQPEKDNSKGR